MVLMTMVSMGAMMLVMMVGDVVDWGGGSNIVVVMVAGIVVAISI